MKKGAISSNFFCMKFKVSCLCSGAILICIFPKHSGLYIKYAGFIFCRNDWKLKSCTTPTIRFLFVPTPNPPLISIPIGSATFIAFRAASLIITGKSYVPLK